MGQITCVDCGNHGAEKEYLLGPDGFVCRSCYEKLRKDPEPVSRLNLPEALGDPAQRALDSLAGLAVGDALGATREGRPYDPSGAPLSLPRSDSSALWTDDTQMALSVVEVLLETGRIDPDRLASAFARRYEPRRGYGAGLHALLSRLRSGENWEMARFAVFRDGSFGNGSAMRVAPLGAFLSDRPADEVVEQATRSAVVTHAHPEGVAGAVVVALAAWHAARSRGDPPPVVGRVFDAVSAVLPQNSAVGQGVASARALAPDESLGRAVALLGNGSRVSCADTVPLALWIATAHMDDYRGAVERAVAAGGDTDTTAAIVGGIVAARTTASAIPAQWRDAVEPLPLVAADPGQR